MKSLLLVRHAKSSWDFNVDDFDRPLNSRGTRDAPEMAERLIGKNIMIDCFISSPAKRAITTATYFAKAFDKKPKHIITIPSLYEPTLQAFSTAVISLDDACNAAALFSHNPGITYFANSLTSTRIDDMPTCAVFAVTAEIKRWDEFASAEKRFWFFDYPKAF